MKNKLSYRQALLSIGVLMVSNAVLLALAFFAEESFVSRFAPDYTYAPILSFGMLVFGFTLLLRAATLPPPPRFPKGVVMDQVSFHVTSERERGIMSVLTKRDGHGPTLSHEDVGDVYRDGLAGALIFNIQEGSFFTTCAHMGKPEMCPILTAIELCVQTWPGERQSDAKAILGMIESARDAMCGAITATLAV